MKYLAVYKHRRDGYYSRYIPDLPGCIWTGVELEDMQRNMHEAFDARISTLTELGQQIPPPTTRSVSFSHPDEGHGIDHWVIDPLGISTTGEIDGVLNSQTEAQDGE